MSVSQYFDSYQLGHASPIGMNYITNGVLASTTCISNHKVVCHILFLDESIYPGSGNREDISNDGISQIVFPVSRYEEIMSTLRNESPLWFHVIDSADPNKSLGLITTSEEPIGDLETENS
jgi:hypothetical protein